MSDVCSPVSSTMYTTLNITLHILILYSFLTVFFVFYVSKAETQAFTDEFRNIIDENLTEALKKADVDAQGQVKKSLQDIQPLLQGLHNVYSKPSQINVNNNKWLFTMAYGIIFVLLLAFTIMVATLKYSCNTCIPLSHLLKENLLVFVVIGIAEFLFFTRIASKFIPVPPSLLITSLVDRVKQNLAPPQNAP
jgi:ABC-type multidrug transport system fused ATPase/permease subunit